MEDDEFRVFTFGKGRSEGNKGMKSLLGGKGANLAEMASIGLSVPPGLTISTEACQEYQQNGKKLPEGLWEEILEGLESVEKDMGAFLGDPSKPLLLSVRSGAAISMPGMMDTVLNLGLNDEVVAGLAAKSGERFAYDSYRRFLDMFGDVVMGIPHSSFEEKLEKLKDTKGVNRDTDLTAAHLKELVEMYKNVYLEAKGERFPSDPKKQLELAVNAVFDSWDSPRAIKYRSINQITGLKGTAVNIQCMVFGNMGNTSGTGVLFTRNPSTGEKKLYGEFLLNAQGEDVVAQTHDVIMTLDKTISSLEMQLAAARASKGDGEEGSPMVTKPGTEQVKERQKVFFVMGIMTAFSSRKRRDSIRETWMPQGKELKKLEKEKGIIIRFVIGHSATPGGVLDRTIDAEETQHKDFLRLNHIEGYHELSSKTQIYFSTAVARWDADFYIKVDDDVHINLGMVGSTLARHRSKPRVYTGCMKSGPVLSQTGVKYHEPEYWKFGEEGNKYFRHATGQIYAISKDLATYISVNRHILHRYANEDVSLGSWFIGLDVEHIDDRSFCCGSPPDCEWKAQAGNPCAASFDWSCSGICKSVERMEEVHQRCGEGDGAIWHTSF